jgi:hypothetical protein
MIVFERKILTLLFLLILPSSVFSADLTGEGVSAFRNGNYQKAAEQFADAEQRAPDDLRIVFNRGAALAAAGKFDEAVETLRKSAVAKDAVIAAKSLSLLAQIAVNRVKQLLAEKPEETPPEKRLEILEQLQHAEKYYTETLALEFSESVRMNLEQIRAWRSRIQTDWESFDRSQKRTDDIAKRLQWLEDWEKNVQKSIHQTNETPDSPKKFQTFYETSQKQNQFTEELIALQNDVVQQFSSEQNSTESDAIRQEFERLHTLSENVTESLRKFQGGHAAESVNETVGRMNRLRMNLAPFEVIVQEAEKKQAMLCNENPASGKNVAEIKTPEPPEMDLPEQSREQQLVADWMPLMVFRAKQGLEHLDNGELTEQNPQIPNKNNTNSVNTANTDALRQSMKLAVQYGTEIQTLAEDAADSLAKMENETALPYQNRCLERLREILKPLQQNQNKNQNQEQNQNNDQQQQNQNQSENQSENQNSQSEQDKQKQQDKNNENKSENDDKNSSANQQNKAQQETIKQDSEKQESASQDKQEKDAKRNTELNAEREKADQMLRQVKRRQREANDKRERVRALLMQTAPVEKDW